MDLHSGTGDLNASQDRNLGLWSGISKVLKRTQLHILDFLLPPRCATCNIQTASSGGVCFSCWSRIDFIEAPFCARLGLPFPHQMGDPALCAEAIARPPVFDRARAVAVYEGPARTLVTALKFGDRTDVAPLMADWMVRAGSHLVEHADFITPVPLHRRRLWARKHNQSALLANAIGRRVATPVAPELLCRKRATRAQIGLSARQRAANVRGAFVVKRRNLPALDGKRVLLVDDVFTTGATVTAAARALLRGGAGAVDVLTFARVVAPVQIPI